MAYVSVDKFGNPYTVVGFKANKKGYPVAYWENHNSLYRLELVESKKDGIMTWLRITKTKKQSNWGTNNGLRDVTPKM